MRKPRAAQPHWIAAVLIAAVLIAALPSACSEPAPVARASNELAAAAESPRESADEIVESSAEAPRGMPAGAIHVEPAVILDSTGFESPIAAATLFLPSGWQAQGGVQWGRQFICTNGYAFEWSAASPDGSTRIALLPQQRWESNNYGAGPSAPGCALAPYSNVREVLAALASGLRAEARTVDFRVREDLQQKFAHLNSVTPMPLGEARTWVEAGEITLAFDEAGRPMRASIAVVAVFSLMQSNAGMGVMDALTGSTFPAFAASAPAEQFDAGFFEALRRSIRTSPQWEARIGTHNAAIGRVALEENRKRSAAISRSNEEIARIRSEAWDAQQESADRRAREFGELMRGVETYDDANAPGGQAELSDLYDNAWRLGDGSYVLTNDASFEPYRDLGVEGRKLEAAR